MMLFLAEGESYGSQSTQLFLPEGVTYGAISEAEPLSITHPTQYGFGFLTTEPLAEPRTFEIAPDSYLTLPVGFLGEVHFSGSYF